jgi:adenosine deaminase
MFHNPLVDDYYACIKNLGFGVKDVKQLALNAINSAWCDEETRVSLRTEINNYFKSNNI